MSYFVDRACYSLLRVSLISEITWTQWTDCFINILNIFLILVPTFLPVYTHNLSKTMRVFFLCIPPVGENAAGCLGRNVSPCGDSGVYLTARCGVADVTFEGKLVCACLLVLVLIMSVCDHKGKSVHVTAGLYIHYSMSTMVQRDLHARLTLVSMKNVWVSVWASTQLPPLGFLREKE